MSRIVLITGASSGYGKATVKAFKDNGDTVIMTARNMEKLDQAKNEVGGDLAVSMDVTNPSDWENIAHGHQFPLYTLSVHREGCIYFSLLFVD